MSQLSRNVLSSYGPRVAALVVGLFLFPFIAYHVGLSHYGIWLLISSVTFFFTTDFGFGISAIRYVAAARAEGDVDELRRVVSTTLAFFGVLGLVATVGFVAFMWLFIPASNVAASDHDLATAMVLTVALSFFLLGLPLTVFRFVLAGVHRYDVANAILLGRILLRCALIVALLLGGAGIYAVAMTEAVVTVLAGVLYFAYVRRLVPELRYSWRYVSLALLKSMLPYSLQVFVIGIAALVILQADNLIIGLVLPVASVALYAGAYRVYQACREMAGSVMQPLIPDASAAQARGESERLRRLLLEGTRYTNALVFLLGVPVMFFAEPLLVAWAGDEFSEVALVTQILLAGLLISSNHIVANSLLMGMGRIGRYARYHVIWATANLALSVVLIQWIGLVGVALATVVPLAVLEPFYLRNALREIAVPARTFLATALARALVPALLASSVLWFAVLAVDPQEVAALAVWSAAYGVVFIGLFLRFGLGDTEREWLARTLGVGAYLRRAQPE